VRSQILGQPSFSPSGMSWSMIGVPSRELYKPSAIRSGFPPQGLRFTLSCAYLLRLSCKQSPMDAVTNAQLRKEQLMALPSLSCSLSSLPQARSIGQVSLHPSSMSAQHAAESEAKVRVAPSSAVQCVRAYTLPAAPQSTFKIGHPSITDCDTPAQPTLVSVPSTDDEGV
jgi:hypothetical protein